MRERTESTRRRERKLGKNVNTREKTENLKEKQTERIPRNATIRILNLKINKPGRNVTTRERRRENVSMEKTENLRNQAGNRTRKRKLSAKRNLNVKENRTGKRNLTLRANVNPNLGRRRNSKPKRKMEIKLGRRKQRAKTITGTKLLNSKRTSLKPKSDLKINLKAKTVNVTCLKAKIANASLKINLKERKIEKT